MIAFSLETPRTICFANGSLEKIRDMVRGLGRRVALVCGHGWLGSSPWRARIPAILDGCTIHTVSCPAGEPTCASLASAVAEAGRFGPDVLLAVGGGSVIDTAKALSALLRSPGPAERFLEGLEGSVPVPGPGVPWIAVPTTAGTGAEVTKNAVVKAESLGVKRSMRSAHLLAHAVCVDPELTASLPLGVTGTSGLDALTQLIEAYVTRASTPPVRSLVEGAIPGMLEALVRLPSAPKDTALRSMASYGSLMSGIALANAGLGAAHGFAAAVGGMFDVPHGLACAVFLPYVLRANSSVISPALDRLLRDVPGRSAHDDPAEWLCAEVTRLLGVYGLPSDLRGFGIPRDAIDILAERSSGSSMRGNPRELSMDERREILSRVI